MLAPLRAWPLLAQADAALGVRDGQAGGLDLHIGVKLYGGRREEDRCESGNSPGGQAPAPARSGTTSSRASWWPAATRTATATTTGYLRLVAEIRSLLVNGFDLEEIRPFVDCLRRRPDPAGLPRRHRGLPTQAGRAGLADRGVAVAPRPGQRGLRYLEAGAGPGKEATG